MYFWRDLVIFLILILYCFRLGRRMAFISTAVLGGAMGLIRAFSPNYVMYLVFEFLDAMLGSGVYSSGFILGNIIGSWSCIKICLTAFISEYL